MYLTFFIELNFDKRPRNYMYKNFDKSSKSHIYRYVMKN